MTTVCWLRGGPADMSMPCSRSRRSRSATAGVVDGDHAALAGGEQLARMEREAGKRARRADRPAPVGGARSRRRRPRRSRRPAARTSARIASRSAGTPPWSTAMTALVAAVSARSTAAGVEVVGARVDVGEDGAWRRRSRTALAVAMNENDGTITSSPGPTPEHEQREVQRGGAATTSRRPSAAPHARRERLLELRHPRALRNPAGGDRLGDGGASSSPSQVRAHDRDLAS